MYREGQDVCPLPHSLSCVRDESLQDVSNGSNKHQTRVLSLPMRKCERAHARTMVWVGSCRINAACCAMSTLHRHDCRSFQPPHVGTPLPPFYFFALSCNIPLCIFHNFFPIFFSPFKLYASLTLPFEACFPKSCNCAACSMEYKDTCRQTSKKTVCKRKYSTLSMQI